MTEEDREEREERREGRREDRGEEGAQRGERKGRGGGRGPSARGGARRGRGCPFCEQKAKEVDYKNAEELRRYLTERGKIKPRRKNATCAKHQRRLSVAIKRARHLALLPFTLESVRG